MKRFIIPAFIILALPFGLTRLSAQIVVTQVRGQVAYKTGNVWRAPLAAGMRLQQGTKVSTGARSSAVIKINRHTVTVKSLSMIKLYENTYGRKGESVRIGLRRGTVRARVYRDKKVKTIFKIATPVATSSVRGTEEEVSYGPAKGMKIRIIEGLVSGENETGITKFLFGSLFYSQKPYLSQPDPLYYFLKEQAIMDTRPAILSEDEYSVGRFFNTELIDMWEWYGFSTDLFGGTAYGNYVPVNIIFSWPD